MSLIRDILPIFATIDAGPKDTPDCLKLMNVKGFLVLLPVLMLLTLGAGAQTGHSGNQEATRHSQDIFSRLGHDQDPRLEDLVRLHMRRNQQGGKMQGYRVEIFFSSDLNARQRAQQIKGEFLGSYPDINVYITYVSPDFKVRVGDFRTRNEALKLMNEIQGRFPKAFVVPDLIEIPKSY